MSRANGFYWFKPGPNEPWEVAQWDEDNGCWWVTCNAVPWFPSDHPRIVVGPKIEPPP